MTQPPAQDPAPAGSAALRKGGLLAMPRAVMTPVFALLVAFLACDVAILVSPYYVFRFTENSWGSAERMEFLAKAMASALAFGLVASIAAERRNHSPWAFLFGHCGFWLGLVLALLGWDVDHAGAAPLLVVATGFAGCVVVVVLTSRPAASPPPVRGVLRALCTLTGRCGNIWFGISLMAAIAIAVGAGTIVESIYTAQAAQHYVYRSPWFGAIFFTAGLSMLSATFRKWPFRLEQAGWLTVHSGLALVVIGSMTSFLTKVEGEVEIQEGQRIDSFQLSTRTHLGVYEALTGGAGKPLFQPLIETIADFDINPAEREPGRAYQAEAAPLSVTVDRFFGTGRHQVDWHDDGSALHAGVVLDAFVGDAQRPKTLRLDEKLEPDAMLPLQVMQLPVALRRVQPRMVDAMLRAEAPKDHGKIVVKDREGRTLLELPVNVDAATSRPEGNPASLAGSARIPGTGIDVRLEGYCDSIGRSEPGAPEDASPGNPINPTVLVRIVGPEGEDSRQVHAFFDEVQPRPGSGRYPYVVIYEFEPRIQIDGPVLLILMVEDRMRFVYASRDGRRVSGAVEPGVALDLPMPFVKLVPTQIFRHLRVEDSYTFDGYEAKLPVIRLTPRWNGVAGDPLWVPLGESRAFEHEDRRFVVSWRPTARPLGFSLALYDFHRDFHPGSEQPSTFESYLRLVHPAKFPSGEDIKIDMNHPLRLDGWRLYQARFGNDRTTILQVNRDPGLVIVYPACAVVLLGLIVVLFMKKTLLLLRRKLERERATPAMHVSRALASVGAVGIGPAIFSVYVAIRPWAEQHLGLGLPLAGWPAFAFGLSLVVLFPIMVVVWFTSRLHRRLAASLAADAGPGAAP